MNLVIVETPAEAKRVSDVMGEGWQVEPCYGAVRNLPADTLGVDVQHDFHPTYTLLPRKGNLVRRLMRAISKADAVYVATPPDRTGEAMGWHLLALSPALDNKPVYRVPLNALTPDAIRTAFDNPRSLNMNWVKAEETRRIVDRLVSYLLSPLASKVLNTEAAFSRAGIICLRLLVEREREIAAFTPKPTWTVIAQLAAEELEFEARLCNARGAMLTFSSQQQAEKLAALLAKISFWVGKAAVRTTERSAPQAYTSQTLLADAALRLGFAPSRVLSVAQTLYEAGRITYPNTDSVAAATEAREAGRAYILRVYGTGYLPTESSHPNESVGMECIRPTDVSHLQDDLPGDGALLYGLIWRRFVASCIASAKYRQSSVRIFIGTSREKPFPFEFRAQAQQLEFDGWLRALPNAVEPEPNVFLPQLTDGASLKLVEARIHERRSNSPTRHTPAGLVATLAARGFSHPATDVAGVNALADSGWVKLSDGQLALTELGRSLAGFVEAHFSDVLSLRAATELEGAFDRIAAGEADRLSVLQDFWTRFSPALGAEAQGVLDNVAPQSMQTPHEHRPIVLRPLVEG